MYACAHRTRRCNARSRKRCRRSSSGRARPSMARASWRGPRPCCSRRVSYVGGYQGAPVSHLLDVLVDAEDILGDLGVHLETCTNEASAAAMLGASINYPLRGAVTWKSIVGTNVAADALSNLS